MKKLIRDHTGKLKHVQVFDNPNDLLGYIIPILKRAVKEWTEDVMKDPKFQVTYAIYCKHTPHFRYPVYIKKLDARSQVCYIEELKPDMEVTLNE